MLPLILCLNEQVFDPSSGLFSKSDRIQMFTQPIECLEYTQNHQYKPVFLLIPGSTAKEVVALVFDKEDDLLERLWNEISSYSQEQVH
jgi:hypothetical protein